MDVGRCRQKAGIVQCRHSSHDTAYALLLEAALPDKSHAIALPLWRSSQLRLRMCFLYWNPHIWDLQNQFLYLYYGNKWFWLSAWKRAQTSGVPKGFAPWAAQPVSSWGDNRAGVSWQAVRSPHHTLPRWVLSVQCVCTCKMISILVPELLLGAAVFAGFPAPVLLKSVAWQSAEKSLDPWSTRKGC